MDAIFAEWIVEWKALVSTEEVSDDKASPPTDAPVDQEPMHDNDRKSREESLKTLTDS